MATSNDLLLLQTLERMENKTDALSDKVDGLGTRLTSIETTARNNNKRAEQKQLDWKYRTGIGVSVVLSLLTAVTNAPHLFIHIFS